MARPALLVKGLAVALGVVSGCSVAAQAAQPIVVAVDGTLCDITRTVVGAAAKVTCLIPPGGDPHGYRLKPSDRQAIATSAAVVHIGFGPPRSQLNLPVWEWLWPLVKGIAELQGRRPPCLA